MRLPRVEREGQSLLLHGQCSSDIVMGVAAGAEAGPARGLEMKGSGVCGMGDGEWPAGEMNERNRTTLPISPT